MRVIPPLDLYGSAKVTSSTIAEPDTTTTPAEAVWSSGTTYALNGQAIETTNHRKYQSLQAGNLNHALPNYALGETSNAWWVDVGPTNKWAMFDLMRSTATVGASPLTVVLTPGQRVNSVALMNLVAQTVTISATSVTGGGTVYGPVVKNVSQRTVATWYDYFYGAFNLSHSTIITDLPVFGDLVITVTIANPGGNATCGAIVLGTQTYIGFIEYNPISDAVNFSTVTRDSYGQATLIPKRSVPKTSQKVVADSSLVNTIRQLRSDLNAKVAVWYGLDDLTSDYGETMLILGFYRSWTIDLSGPNVCEQTIEIEEI